MATITRPITNTRKNNR